MRGTEITKANDVADDFAMFMKKLPNQYADAQKFYKKVNINKKNKMGIDNRMIPKF